VSEPLLKPRSDYEVGVRDRKAIASREASALANELSQHQSNLDDHGYIVEHSNGSVAVKLGAFDIVRVTFNYADSGRHRVTNGVAEALRRGLAVDFDDASVARYEFKVQLRHATDLFYANKSQIEALGLV